MGLIADTKAGPVAGANAITDHAVEQLRAVAADVVKQLGPQGEALGARLDAAIVNLESGALRVGEALEDHAAPLAIQIIDAFFKRLFRARIVIDVQERQ